MLSQNAIIILQLKVSKIKAKGKGVMVPMMRDTYSEQNNVE